MSPSLCFAILAILHHNCQVTCLCHCTCTVIQYHCCFCLVSSSLCMWSFSASPLSFHCASLSHHHVLLPSALPLFATVKLALHTARLHCYHCHWDMWLFRRHGILLHCHHSSPCLHHPYGRHHAEFCSDWHSAVPLNMTIHIIQNCTVCSC